MFCSREIVESKVVSNVRNIFRPLELLIAQLLSCINLPKKDFFLVMLFEWNKIPWGMPRSQYPTCLQFYVLNVSHNAYNSTPKQWHLMFTLAGSVFQVIEKIQIFLRKEGQWVDNYCWQNICEFFDTLASIIPFTSLY